MMGRIAVIVVLGLAAGLLLVRATAPAVQNAYLKWGTIYTERAATYRELERNLSKASVKGLVANPAGALLAATVCGDEQLGARAEKAWLAYVRKGERGSRTEHAGRIMAEVTRAGAVDPRLKMILTKDCTRTLELASATVSKYEP